MSPVRPLQTQMLQVYAMRYKIFNISGLISIVGGLAG